MTIHQYERELERMGREIELAEAEMRFRAAYHAWELSRRDDDCRRRWESQWNVANLVNGELVWKTSPARGVRDLAELATFTACRELGIPNPIRLDYYEGAGEARTWGFTQHLCIAVRANLPAAEIIRVAAHEVRHLDQIHRGEMYGVEWNEADAEFWAHRFFERHGQALMAAAHHYGIN